MEKKGTKGRTIKYSSIKNDEIMIVHSQEAKHYADCLEQIDEVLKYETLKELDNSLFSKVNKLVNRFCHLLYKRRHGSKRASYSRISL